MNYRIFLAIAVALLLTYSMAQQDGKPRPNILFILVDDLGWGDLGLNYQNGKSGKKHATPELDAMGRQGVRMTAHYCPSPICAPSRGSLLLGQHQGHAEIRDRQFDKALPEGLSLGTAMQSSGYRTVMIGKYGLQGDGTDPESWPAYPTKRGFSEFFGYVRHVDGHLHYPAHFWPIGDQEKHTTPKQLWHQQDDLSSELKGCYTTDLFTAFAKKWIIEHHRATPQKPFMMLLTYDTPHAALQVASMPYPEGKGLHGGIQWLGDSGKMINTAQGAIDSYIHPDYRKVYWSEVEQRFASSVRRIDSAVGDVLQLLRDLNIDRNTLVVFTSDNGPHNQSYIAGKDYNPTSFKSYGPFDGAKSDIWEGGIRVPALAWWPDTIPEGHVDNSISQFHDWMATFVELAGLPRPAICDGINLMPHLTGSGPFEPSTVYIEYNSPGTTSDYADFDVRKRGLKRNHMHALFLDGFKGVRTSIKSHEDDFEIYDLDSDPGERNNLLGSHPDFALLNQRMKSRVLQIHKASKDAPRPYDNIRIPAAEVSSNLQPGLQWTALEGTSPWVANIQGATTRFHVECDKTPPWKSGYLYQAEGFIKVPEGGKVILHLQSAGRFVVKVHENVVLERSDDDEFGTFDSDIMNLSEGLHPIRIYAKDMVEGAEFNLYWTVNEMLSSLPEGSLVSAL